TDGSGRDAEHELGPAFRDLPVLRVRVDGGGNCGCTLLLPDVAPCDRVVHVGLVRLLDAAAAVDRGQLGLAGDLVEILLDHPDAYVGPAVVHPACLVQGERFVIKHRIDAPALLPE